ncbi:MAG: GAF domain-containing protein [Deltaproteobacteria bacterium]|nr:GAF domain-containing protein [Deltaproteobacteria bacterium]
MSARSPPELSLDAPDPLADAARGRRPGFLTGHAELLARYPQVGDLPADPPQAVAGLPLVHAGELLGGFALSFGDRERLDTGAQQWLLSFASQVALAVERARAYEAEQRARAQAETLYRIADSLSATQLDLDAAAVTDRSALRPVLQRCCDLLVERSEIALARIWTVDAGGALVAQASATLPAPQQRGAADHELHGLAAEVAQRKRSHITRELALFPLTVDEKLVGVMALRAQFPSVTDTLEQLGSSARTIAIGIERLRIHADRERLVEELERTVRFNETFAGMLGHDLRNPLGSMVTGTQLVLLRTADEKITGPLGRVLSAGDRMARMIDQLLDFTRARVGGGLAIQPRAANLRKLVDQAVEEVAVAHPAWKFDVETTGDTTGSWDADRMTQVFSNLLGNAVQHGVQQLPIRVAIDGTHGGQIAVTLWNGGAIPIEILPILFEPFRGSRHKRNGSKGLGLGLFITQQIIRAHGGDIAVASTVEGGTSFTIHLPRQAS